VFQPGDEGAPSARVALTGMLCYTTYVEQIFYMFRIEEPMPAQSRTADEPPKRTPSFVCEVPLRVHPQEERTLLARLEAARQVYNACLGEARKRVRLVRESKAFQRARTLSRDDPERKRLFAQARAQHACSDYALQAYAKPFLRSWLGEHLDSHTIQKLASRAFGAANRLLVGRAKRVRFKGKHQLDSVEGKTNANGIRWCGTAWNGWDSSCPRFSIRVIR
jgi:putative transposase